jgi:glycosyltransferase involved in cell wall biosynthesis
MFIGRVQCDKGVIDLLDAFGGLRQVNTANVGLVYVGDGNDVDLLRSRVRERNLDDSVLLLGKIPHAQLPAIMRCATVVVAPTRPEFPEGRCMVVLESLVLGVPVIAPNFGPFPYAIEHGVNGMLFEPGSSDALRRCLAQLIQEKGLLERLRHGAQGRAAHNIVVPQSFARAVDETFGKALSE